MPSEKLIFSNKGEVRVNSSICNIYYERFFRSSNHTQRSILFPSMDFCMRRTTSTTFVTLGSSREIIVSVFNTFTIMFASDAFTEVHKQSVEATVQSRSILFRILFLFPSFDLYSSR